MYSTINYDKFVNNEFNLIKHEFEEVGYKVNSETDFSTYQGWINKGRKVKRGQKGLTIKTSQKYSMPLFIHGCPIIDPNTGKQKFFKGTKRYTLFSKEQTEKNTNPKFGQCRVIKEGHKAVN